MREKERIFVKLVLLTILNSKSSLGTRECCPTNTFLKLGAYICSDNTSIVNLNCPDGAVLLNPSDNENDKFSIESNTTLVFLDGETKSNDEFCLGKLESNGSEISVALTCFDKWQGPNLVSIIHRVLMLISTIFLLITLYIYLVLPNLKDFQGKCVLVFICCLIASYMTLLTTQTFQYLSDLACVIQATLLYFFMSATFFWNNIITFNIWKAIRNVTDKTTENCRTMIYILWGFGVPLLMVIICMILEHIPGDNHVRPHFGETKCWFSGKVESWSYFYGPISILLILNTIMFLQSTRTLWKSYRGSNISELRSLRYKYMMYLKLFLLMGITWIFEVVSFATSSNGTTNHIWFLTDSLNSGQGILIFLILVVFRQKVKIGLLKKKLCGINWPQSWADGEMEESSNASFSEEFELNTPKLKMISEFRK